MKFEWDENKSERCFRERGFDFAYAAKAFFDRNRIIKTDDRFDYGETRFIMYGTIDERLFCIAYTVRKDAVRIISARKANSREVSKYGIQNGHN